MKSSFGLRRSRVVPSPEALGDILVFYSDGADVKSLSTDAFHFCRVRIRTHASYTTIVGRKMEFRWDL